MEILGIGPLEVLFILIIALIVIGPKDMAKTGRTIGRWMRTIVTSPTWHSVQHATRELRTLPYKLMREAGIEEEDMKKIRQDIGLNSISKDLKNIESDISPWTTAPTGAPSIQDEDPGLTIATPAEPPSTAPLPSTPTTAEPDQAPADSGSPEEAGRN